MKDINDDSVTRRTIILDAAKHIFQRYGFKKTSMDDLARAAGLSRQGLYLYFPNKQALFKAMVMSLLEFMHLEASKALARDEADVEVRVLDAFDAMFAESVGSENMDELSATMVELIGSDDIRQIENEFVSEVTRVLRSAGIGGRWKKEGVSAKDLADLLFAASDGIKRRARTPDEYRNRMRIAVMLVCQGDGLKAHIAIN